MFKSDGANFPKQYTMTIGCELSQKSLVQPDKKYTVEFYIFDVAGQEIYKDLVYSYLDGAAMMAIVYDVSNPNSLQSVTKWLELAKGEADKPPPGVLIANKNDLEERIVVKADQGQQMAAANNLKFFETSALRGTGIEAPFQYLAKKYVEHYEDKLKIYESLRP